MDIDTFQTFLLRLRDECNAQITGSYAVGRAHHYSDIDLVIPNKTEKKSYIDKAISIFAEFNVPWESAIIGSISSPRNLECLPKPIEVMEKCWIKKVSNTAKYVTVFGVEFKVY